MKYQLLLYALFLQNCGLQKKHNKVSASNTANQSLYWVVESCHAGDDLCTREVSFDPNFGGYYFGDDPDLFDISIDECEFVEPLTIVSEGVCDTLKTEDIANRKMVQVSSFEELGYKTQLHHSVEEYLQITQLGLEELQTCEQNPQYRESVGSDFLAQAKTVFLRAQENTNNPVSFYKKFYYNEKNTLLNDQTSLSLLESEASTADAVKSVLTSAGGLDPNQPVEIDVITFNRTREFNILENLDNSVEQVSKIAQGLPEKAAVAATSLKSSINNLKEEYRRLDERAKELYPDNLAERRKYKLKASAQAAKERSGKLAQTFARFGKAIDEVAGTGAGNAFEYVEQAAQIKRDREAEGSHYYKSSGLGMYPSTSKITSRSLSGIQDEDGEPYDRHAGFLNDLHKVEKSSAHIQDDPFENAKTNVDRTAVRLGMAALTGNPVVITSVAAQESAAMAGDELAYRQHSANHVYLLKQGGEVKMGLHGQYHRDRDPFLSQNDIEQLKEETPNWEHRRSKKIPFKDLQKSIEDTVQAADKKSSLDTLRAAAYSAQIDQDSRKVTDKLKQNDEDASTKDQTELQQSVARVLVESSDTRSSQYDGFFQGEEGKKAANKFYISDYAIARSGLYDPLSAERNQIQDFKKSLKEKSDKKLSSEDIERIQKFYENAKNKAKDTSIKDLETDSSRDQQIAHQKRKDIKDFIDTVGQDLDKNLEGIDVRDKKYSEFKAARNQSIDNFIKDESERAKLSNDLAKTISLAAVRAQKGESEYETQRRQMFESPQSQIPLSKKDKVQKLVTAARKKVTGSSGKDLDVSGQKKANESFEEKVDEKKKSKIKIKSYWSQSLGSMKNATQKAQSFKKKAVELQKQAREKVQERRKKKKDTANATCTALASCSDDNDTLKKKRAKEKAAAKKKAAKKKAQKKKAAKKKKKRKKKTSLLLTNETMDCGSPSLLYYQQILETLEREIAAQHQTNRITKP